MLALGLSKNACAWPVQECLRLACPRMLALGLSKNRRSTPEDKNEGAEVKTANKFVFSLTWNQISHTQQCKLTFIVFIKSNFYTNFVLLKDFFDKNTIIHTQNDSFLQITGRKRHCCGDRTAGRRGNYQETELAVRQCRTGRGRNHGGLLHRSAPRDDHPLEYQCRGDYPEHGCRGHHTYRGVLSRGKRGGRV